MTRVTRRSALAALAAAAAPACRRDTRRVIGVIPQGRTHLFWRTIQAGCLTAAKELNIEISWNAPQTETDYNGQLQMVEAMINRRVDALCLAPIDKKAMVSAVERAAREKIPVIIFDSGVETDVYTSWIATNNYLAGQMAAERIGEILGGKGKVAVVAAVPGVASTMAREQGFEEKLKAAFPGIAIADKRFGNSDFARSMAVAENMLTAIPNLDAFFASNESSTVGAVQALKSRQSKVKLVGFDWSPNLIDELRAGTMDSLIAQDPFQIGYRSVTSAMKALRGEQVEKVQSLTPRLIRQADLETPEVKALLNPDLSLLQNAG